MIMIDKEFLDTISSQFNKVNTDKEYKCWVRLGYFDSIDELKSQLEFLTDLESVSNGRINVDKTPSNEYNRSQIQVKTKHNELIFDSSIVRSKQLYFIDLLLHSCHQSQRTQTYLPIKLEFYSIEHCPSCLKMLTTLVSYSFETGYYFDMSFLNLSSLDTTKYNVMSVPFIVITNLQNQKEKQLTGWYNERILTSNILEVQENENI